jgi:hypothetical protein
MSYKPIVPSHAREKGAKIVLCELQQGEKSRGGRISEVKHALYTRKRQMSKSAEAAEAAEAGVGQGGLMTSEWV